MKSIDLNCDLAEGGAFDEALMQYISSCNIACGGHYGDLSTVRTAVKLAAENKVNIGAHPSYPDQENFGRKSIEIDLKKLRKELKIQILRVKNEAKRLGEKLHHVKPHGALYNDLVTNEEKATMLIQLIVEIDKDLILFVPPKSVIQKLAKNKIETWVEGFADRNYEDDFSLVSRSKNDAVLHDKKLIFQHVFSMADMGEVKSKNETILKADFNTICVHSDTENSVEILKHLRAGLIQNNIDIYGACAI